MEEIKTSGKIKKLDDIIEIVKANKEKIRKFGVIRIGVFGSYVRCEQDGNSDIDMIAEFEDGKETFRNFMRLSKLLEEILLEKIDLLTPNGISPFIKPYIDKEVKYEEL